MKQTIRGLACPTCKEMVLFLEKHRCHQYIIEKLDNYLDYAISQEKEFFEEDLEMFWHSKDVKFFKFLLENDKMDEI